MTNVVSVSGALVCPAYAPLFPWPLHMAVCVDCQCLPLPPLPLPQGNHECVELVARSGLDVFAHNVETVSLPGPRRAVGWCR
jgi:hypothetical protein